MKPPPKRHIVPKKKLVGGRGKAARAALRSALPCVTVEVATSNVFMLQPFLNHEGRWAQTWEELGEGVPTLTGFARLCSMALTAEPRLDAPFSLEAHAILYVARERGMIEVKGSHRAFDAPARLLAVQVETGPSQVVVFRNREQPEVTIGIVPGFHGANPWI